MDYVYQTVSQSMALRTGVMCPTATPKYITGPGCRLQSMGTGAVAACRSVKVKIAF